ncbi:MAG TPA: hypothetical protein VGW40_11450 [Allosphingosinicella sp.]|nr:hypothetical protein [Allosphingosinicella sp.]
MRKLAILCASAAAAAGLAQALAVADPPAGTSRQVEGDPNQMVCRSETETRSRIKGRRICLTRAQWREVEARSRALAREMQRATPPGCGPDPSSGMMC